MADAGSSSNSSPIVDWFRGRSVFITGATGFMGKVLVEKLLRSCPDISAIYLLMRPKRGHDVKARLEELTSSTIFDWLKRERPESLTKLVPISGDITSPDLGISPSDQKLLFGNVSVVFHSAASVKFDEVLKESVKMNLIAPKRILQLCHKMAQLEALVHVSTAYCNCTQEKMVGDIVYPPPADPERVIQCVESMDEEVLNSITKTIIGKHPNTYTFTKAMAEHILVQEGAGLPIAIVRPSIVTAAWREPIPGWVDNINGPTGLIAGVGKGLLRTMMCNRNFVADLIPVDVAINLMISVAWHTATTRPSSIQVYHCATGTLNPITWAEIEEIGYKIIINNPFNDIIWYPGGSFKSSRILNKICVFMFQFIPACALDFMSRMTGKKPVMMRLHRRLQSVMSYIEFFTTREWKFDSENVKRLRTHLHPRDLTIFNFDVMNLEWRKYLEQYVLGTRKYVFKEDPSTFPTARSHLRKKAFEVHEEVQRLAEDESTRQRDIIVINRNKSEAEILDPTIRFERSSSQPREDVHSASTEQVSALAFGMEGCHASLRHGSATLVHNVQPGVADNALLASIVPT